MLRHEPMPSRQAFGPTERAAVQEVLDYYKDEDPPYGGYFEKRFSDAFVLKMGGGLATPVATGTGACYLALAALKTYYNLPEGGEVILSPVTDSGPIAAIVALGFVPVIADSAPNSYNVNRQSIIDCVTDRTVAVFLVHAAGGPVSDIAEIASDCSSSGIKLLEDCSQAPFAMADSLTHMDFWEAEGKMPKFVGSYGDIAAFSTMYRKNLQSGGSGGIVYVPFGETAFNSEKMGLFHHVLAHKDRGKPTWRDDINQNDPGNAIFPALNWNTDEISCAIGTASLHRIEDTIHKRNEFIVELQKKLDKYSEVCSVYFDYHEGFSPFYIPIHVDTSKLYVNKIEFAEAVRAEGVGLLSNYGCLVADWEWADEYINWQPSTKYSEGYVPFAAKTPNASGTRATTFNLFLNENYGKDEAVDIALSIARVEERTLRSGTVSGGS